MEVYRNPLVAEGESVTNNVQNINLLISVFIDSRKKIEGNSHAEILEEGDICV